MKRLAAVSLSIAMAVLLASCGFGSSEDGHREVDWEPVGHLTLALRSGTYADVIEESVTAFEEETHIYCELLKLGEDELHSGVMDDSANEEGSYDICMVDGSWMAEYTENGVLLNLSDYGYELDDDIIPATRKICYHDGDTYLAPYYGNVTILLYNKRLAQAAGYKDGEIGSLEDMMQICSYAASHRNLGFLYRGDTENNIVVDFLPILLSYGGWVVDEDNRPTVDTPEFHAAMEYYLELIATGKAETKDNLILAIVNQAAAMGVGWPGWYTPERNGQADYAAITGRVSSGSKAYNANVYGIWTIGVTANSRNKENAVKLLEYLMDPEVQKATVPSGGVPCRYSSLKDPGILEDFPQYEPVCEALEGGVYRPIMAEWTDFYTILGTEMRFIINGEKTIDAGLSDAQSQLEDMLK
ncbi:MAG: extracellular solute-binding protein [Lachnospiraceae bacterium]|nr:extracellular solute-binding protein [Lachnospiraceae bacterium]